MKTFTYGAMLLPFLALAFVGVGEAVGDVDEWICASAEDPDLGYIHYDNVFQGITVHAPDGRHATWGMSFCTISHQS